MTAKRPTSSIRQPSSDLVARSIAPDAIAGAGQNPGPDCDDATRLSLHAHDVALDARSLRNEAFKVLAVCFEKSSGHVLPNSD